MCLTLTPPPIPQDAVYTSYYCEENIYLLAQSFSTDPDIIGTWDIFVVFISNSNKKVALWCQKLASAPQWPVVWDYHVVLVLRPRDHVLPRNAPEADGVTVLDGRTRSWTYDFDTCLDVPCTLQDYLNKTFEEVSVEFQSLFRVVPCSMYLNHFASDRSHMLRVKEDDISVPPPLYEPIRGATRIALKDGISNNLMSGFVCMESSEDTYGDVVVLDSLRLWR